MKKHLLLPSGTHLKTSSEIKAYCELVKEKSVETLNEYYPVRLICAQSIHSNLLKRAGEVKGKKLITVDIRYDTSIRKLIASVVWCINPALPLSDENLLTTDCLLPFPEELLRQALFKIREQYHKK